MEVRLLKILLDERIKHVHSLGLVTLPTPQEIMAEVVWLYNEDEVRDYLMVNIIYNFCLNKHFSAQVCF